MSVTSTHQFKKDVTNPGTPDDTIYLKPIRLSCSLCAKHPRRKVFGNLWCLYLHFRIHTGDYETKQASETIRMLSFLIKGGTLR